MPLLMSNYDAILKDFYEGGVREQVNQDVVAFKELSETDKQFSGRRLVFPIHTTRNGGVGARAENATLPSATNQGSALEVVTSCYHYGKFSVTGQTLAAGKNAFIEAMSWEMDNLVKDVVNDCGRITWGTGDGRMAMVGASGALTLSGTAITLKNRYLQPGQPGARYLAAGQKVDFGTVASPAAHGTNVEVKSVSRSLNPATTVDTVQVSGSYAGVSQSESFVFINGAGGAGVEPLGLQALVDVYTESNYWGSNAFYGTTILGLNRSTTDAANCLILGNSGTARIIDSNLIQTGMDYVHVESGEKVDFFWSEHGVARAFFDAVSNDRRFNSTNFDAGYSKLSYAGVPFIVDRHAPYNNLLIGKRSSLKKATLQPGKFADRDGAVLRNTGGNDVWEGFYGAYWNLFIDGNFKSLLFIRDIKTDL